MNRLTGLTAAMVLATTLLWTPAPAASPKAPTPAPAYTADGRLVFPTGYYQWAFLTSDLGMDYNENGSGSDQPPFSNVFATPESYGAFLQSGRWPEGTVLVKEFRPSSSKGSINHHGFFQSGPASGVLVHVKDKHRFKGGWAFFVFSGEDHTPARPLPTTTSCYSCHEDHGAVDTTFVQFYPTLLPIARQQQTLSASYLRDEAGGAGTSSTSN